MAESKGSIHSASAEVMSTPTAQQGPLYVIIDFLQFVDLRTLIEQDLLTIIGVCVAILGVGHTLVLKWDNLTMCIARRCDHHHSRSRRNVAGEFTYNDYRSR
jgi:hypothetical protein